MDICRAPAGALQISNGGVTFTSFNGSAGVSDLKLDITDLSDGVLDLGGDFIAFADATDGNTKTESVADFVALLAGAAISQNASSKALEVSVDDSSIEIASDSIQVKSGGITNAMLAGSIANAKLANNTISGVALGANLFSLSKATNSGLAMTSFNGSAAVSDLALDVMDLVEESASTSDILYLVRQKELIANQFLILLTSLQVMAFNRFQESLNLK